MKEKDILKDYFNFNKKNQNQNLEQSYNFTPYSLELPQDSSPIKFNPYNFKVNIYNINI